jgi:hypothetical protein
MLLPLPGRPSGGSIRGARQNFSVMGDFSFRLSKACQSCGQSSEPARELPGREWRKRVGIERKKPHPARNSLGSPSQKIQRFRARPRAPSVPEFHREHGQNTDRKEGAGDGGSEVGGHKIARQAGCGKAGAPFEPKREHARFRSRACRARMSRGRRSESARVPSCETLRLEPKFYRPERPIVAPADAQSAGQGGTDPALSRPA